MKKLKYERAEIEVALLDPSMDIIITSGGTGETGPGTGTDPASIINIFNE